MLSKESLYVIFFSIPLYQLIFFTIQSVSFKWSKGRSRFMLGVIMLVLTVILFFNTLYYFQYLQAFQIAYYFYLPLLLTVFPLVYIYLQSLTGGLESVNVRRLLVLLLPSILILILNLFTWGTLDKELKIAFLQNGFRITDSMQLADKFIEQVFWLGNVALLGGQLVLVAIKSGGTILKFKQNTKDDLSFRPWLNLRWLMFITIGFICMVVCLSVMNILTPIEDLTLIFAYNLIMLISGAMAGFFGLRQERLKQEVATIHMELPAVTQTKTGVVQNTGTGVQVDTGNIPENYKDIIKSLRKLLEEEKSYLDPGLSLETLAIKLNIPKRDLSIVINTIMDQNFYGIINEYRIKETIRILKSDEYETYTIEAIAEKVGFRSKSSFNACFKKFTGVTPTQYKESGPNK